LFIPVYTHFLLDYIRFFASSVHYPTILVCCLGCLLY